MKSANLYKLETSMPNRRCRLVSVCLLKLSGCLIAALTFAFLMIVLSYKYDTRPRSIHTVVEIPLYFQSPPRRRAGRECYTADHIDAQRIRLLDDVLTKSAKRPERNASNIFFHETTCLDGRLRLNVRQACAVESAARANRDADVFVLFTSPVGVEHGHRQPAVFDALGRYANIHWRNLNLWTYTLDTPAASWIDSNDQLFESQFPTEHMADMLRLISLFKWGGTHMDLDFVVRRTFGAEQNFAAVETDQVVTNSLMNFAAYGVGHRIVERALQEFVRDFRGDEWSTNGPLLVSRVLHDMCGTADLLACPIYRIHPMEWFFAVSYNRWRLLFEPKHAAEVAALVNGSVAVHFWNRLSAGTAVRLGEGSAYERLAREFCPEVVKSIVGGEF